jgi:hypothetical protein
MVNQMRTTIVTYADHDYLLDHARRLFPGGKIQVTHTDDEVIHIDVNGHRYTFEITSEDESYVFSDGRETFTIPLMENPDAF